MNYIYYVLALLILARMMVLIIKRSKFILHIFQLEEYDIANYKETLNKNSEIIFSSKVMDITASKALVFTSRAKRLYLTNLIISITLLLLSVLPFILTVKFLYIIFLLLASFFIYRQQPYIILFSNALLVPFENNMYNSSYIKAQEKIEKLKDLKVIGITGSLGKTATASIVEEMLNNKYKVFNYDNRHIKKLADKIFKEKLLYGLDNIEGLDIYADNIVMSELGSTFTIKDKEGNSQNCKTKLLSRHDISNTLAGVCASRALGLSFEEIRKVISNIEPIAQ